MEPIGRLVRRFPVPVLLVSLAVCALAFWPVPKYAQDPWEYNFSKLGSKNTRKAGAGNWSNRSNELFKARGGPFLALADDVTQVRKVARAYVENDRKLFKGKYIKSATTVWDSLGGEPELMKEKLTALRNIRTTIDKSMKRLSETDKKIALEWRPPEYLRALRPTDLPPLVQDAYREKDGRVGTPVYVQLADDVSQSNGKNLLQISELLDTVKLPDGRVVPNAARATVFAEMIRSMERDGPRATLIAFLVVLAITLSVTMRPVPALAVIGSLLAGIVWTVGLAAWFDVRLNFLNFVALPLTFGIGVEYSINLFERIRHSDGDVVRGLSSAGGPIVLCSLTTMLGYGSLLTGDSQALESFGRYAVAGEIGCIITAMLILPSAIQLSRRFGLTRL